VHSNLAGSAAGFGEIPAERGDASSEQQEEQEATEQPCAPRPPGHGCAARLGSPPAFLLLNPRRGGVCRGRGHGRSWAPRPAPPSGPSYQFRSTAAEAPTPPQGSPPETHPVGLGYRKAVPTKLSK
jgi:hypothetical protein